MEVGMRSKIRRLERAAREGLASFELLDGSVYWYDPESFFEVFGHYLQCLRTSAHDWPDAPAVVQKVTEAKDVEAAIPQVFGAFLPYDRETLVKERRLVPRSLVSRFDPETKTHVPLDPYAERPGDLSEP
jgi:hypothetical protein